MTRITLFAVVVLTASVAACGADLDRRCVAGLGDMPIRYNGSARGEGTLALVAADGGTVGAALSLSLPSSTDSPVTVAMHSVGRCEAGQVQLRFEGSPNDDGHSLQVLGVDLIGTLPYATIDGYGMWNAQVRQEDEPPREFGGFWRVPIGQQQRPN